MSKINNLPDKKKVLASLKLLSNNQANPLQLASSQHSQIPLPETSFLKDFLQRNDNYVRDALSGLNIVFARDEFKKPNLDFYFGTLWSRHSLQSSSLFWWRMPSEYDITQLLLKIFQPSNKHGNSSEALTFLQAVTHSMNKQNEKWQLPHPYKDNLSVQAEVRTVNGNYLDLLFLWGNKTVPFALAIEVKFGARLINDLQDYETLTKGIPSPQKYHIVLGCKDELKDNPQWENWTFCYWSDVLRKWENILQKQQIISSEDCYRLRNSLWHKIGVYE